MRRQAWGGAYKWLSECLVPRWHIQRLSDCLKLPFEQILLLSLCKRLSLYLQWFRIIQLRVSHQYTPSQLCVLLWGFPCCSQTLLRLTQKLHWEAIKMEFRAKTCRHLWLSQTKSCYLPRLKGLLYNASANFCLKWFKLVFNVNVYPSDFQALESQTLSVNVANLLQPFCILPDIISYSVLVNHRHIK